jgi:hypothetical protein
MNAECEAKQIFRINIDIKPWRVKVPTISMFYGIIIYMFFYDDKKHKLPHIHASYGDDDAVFSIDDGEILNGSIPNNKKRLVQAWIEIHREDLLTDWRLAVSGQNPLPIKPLE